ncbi:MAG TPA: hypothetical protein VF911_11450 [Thermoanaerobaculia bacterium]
MRTSTLALVLSIFLSAAASADLVVPQTSTARILIPVAGDAAGANGTHFRSDISIVNFRNVEQRIVLRWLPQGQSGTAVPTRSVTLNPRTGLSSNDFVNTVLGQTGIGGIDITAVTADGQFDPEAQLHATVRIWTPQPNVPNGTMSQTFPAIAYNTTGFPLRWIFGVHRSEQYRLNVGIMNPEAVVRRFRITLITNTGARETREVELAPLSIHQEGLLGTAEVLQLIVEQIGGNGPSAWQTWASSVDNVTGDAWSQMGFIAPVATTQQP